MACGLTRHGTTALAGFWDASAGNFGEGSGEVSSPDGEREVEFRYAGPAFSHWYHTFYRVSCERERRS